MPVDYDAGGKLLYASNPKLLETGAPNPSHIPAYMVWDSSREAPPGFGLKVADKKTFVLRRKVHGKSIMPTVGNVADFTKIDDARARAAELARQLEMSGRNPNALARAASAAELTLGQAMARYRSHLTRRVQKKASDRGDSARL